MFFQKESAANQYLFTSTAYLKKSFILRSVLCSVLVTLHHPPQRVLQLCDRAYLLSSDGDVFYDGPVGENCSGIYDYFGNPGKLLGRRLGEIWGGVLVKQLGMYWGTSIAVRNEKGCEIAEITPAALLQVQCLLASMTFLHGATCKMRLGWGPSARHHH